VVGRLVGEVRRLHLDNAALQARVDAQQATITALRAGNQALRDEVARLKGLPPRPPSRPSGMEQATQPGAGGKDERLLLGSGVVGPGPGGWAAGIWCASKSGSS